MGVQGKRPTEKENHPMSVSAVSSHRDLTHQVTQPRPTPGGGGSFKEVLGRSAMSLVKGAESTLTRLPGGPTLASAIRASPGPHVSSHTSPLLAGGGATSATAPASGPSAAGAEASAGAGLGGEQALSQGGDMNLYYLELQEQISAENRAYTTLSNVMKARHDTVKNAIGNIR